MPIPMPFLVEHAQVLQLMGRDSIADILVLLCR